VKELIVKFTRWNSLSSDLRPIDDDDAKCLEELRQVLQKHRRFDRFGLYLLHSLFDVGDDEILFESADHDRREVVLRPVKKSFLGDYELSLQPTLIGFDENGYHQICGCSPHSS